MNDWISVEDEMPHLEPQDSGCNEPGDVADSSGPLLVFDEDDGEQTIAFLENIMGNPTWFNWVNGGFQHGVTHWMKLPKDPVFQSSPEETQ